MRFNDSARVVLGHRQDTGQITRFIIDPVTLAITDIVVKCPGQTGGERVIPIRLVESSTDQSLTIKQQVGGWEQLAPFEETNYLLISEKNFSLPAGVVDHSVPILFVYPHSIPTTGPLYPRPESFDSLPNSLSASYPPQPELAVRGLPDDRLPLIPGWQVISQDRVDLGIIERVLAGTGGEDPVFFVLQRGGPSRERKRVPINWIETVRGKEVQLGVRARFLDWLPDEDETG